MHASLPDVLPPILRKGTPRNKLALRCGFNYCTYSFPMAFWDWKRWERNWTGTVRNQPPLAAVGHECVA